MRNSKFTAAPRRLRSFAVTERLGFYKHVATLCHMTNFGCGHSLFHAGISMDRNNTQSCRAPSVKPNRARYRLFSVCDLGFTLIELLVVITIIGVLAAMLFPVFGRVRAAADRTRCTSNLRQISLAVQNYVLDNDGLLPGPLVGGCCYPGYRRITGDGQLGSLIAPYLGETSPVLAWSPLNVFVCPGWKRFIPPDPIPNSYAPIHPGPVYVRNGPAINGIDPFGYPVVSVPQKASILRDKESSYPFLIDADQRNCSTNSGWNLMVPLVPVHGSVRNQLFFDGHVEVVPAP